MCQYCQLLLICQVITMPPQLHHIHKTALQPSPAAVLGAGRGVPGHRDHPQFPSREDIGPLLQPGTGSPSPPPQCGCDKASSSDYLLQVGPGSVSPSSPSISGCDHPSSCLHHSDNLLRMVTIPSLEVVSYLHSLDQCLPGHVLPPQSSASISVTLITF